jgi:hypothetical protein
MLTAMVWATTVLFASLSAATVPPSRLASTYDEAACAEGAAETELAPTTLDMVTAREESDCRPPTPVPPPAVIDCNDEREVGFLAEMIGSCDMPKAPGTQAALRAQNGPPPNRFCDGIHCTDQSSPLRPASRMSDEDHPLAGTTLVLPRFDEVTALATRDTPQPILLLARRIERPPRNFS